MSDPRQAFSKSIVITGASTGIGKECALHLRARGFQVFSGVRRPADAEALRRESSGRLQPLFLDLTDPASIAAAARTVRESAGAAGLAGLVNNAGVAVGGPLEFIPLEALRRQLEVNVVGQIAVTQAFLPLIRAGGGRIVLIGSISGRLVSPLLGPYAASKFALRALADALRLELSPWSIHVSLIEPGNIRTPIWEKSLSQAEGLVQSLPERAHQLYGPFFDAVRRHVTRRAGSGIPGVHVVRAVEHALTAPRPKARYLVGRDARLLALLAAALPAPFLDRLILRRFKLTK